MATKQVLSLFNICRVLWPIKYKLSSSFKCAFGQLVPIYMDNQHTESCFMVLHSAWFPNVFRVKSVITFSPVPQSSDHQIRFVLPPTFYQLLESSLGVFPFVQLRSISACLEDIQKVLLWSSLLFSFLLLRMSLSVLLANICWPQILFSFL